MALVRHWRLIGRVLGLALRLLLLLVLLRLLLHPLQFIQQLFCALGTPIGSLGALGRLLLSSLGLIGRLSGIIAGIIVVIAMNLLHRLWPRRCGYSPGTAIWSQNDALHLGGIIRRPHNDIVEVRALQQAGEDLVGWGRSEFSCYTVPFLSRRQAFELNAGFCANSIQDVQ